MRRGRCFWARGSDGKRRRAVIDNPKRDRIETFESSNDAFVIEDLGKACLIENIELQ